MWTGIIIGFVTGAFFMLVVIALCQAAASSQEEGNGKDE